MAHKKTTSRRVATTAARALRSSRSSRTTRTVAASALAQSPGKHRGKGEGKKK